MEFDLHRWFQAAIECVLAGVDAQERLGWTYNKVRRAPPVYPTLQAVAPYAFDLHCPLHHARAGTAGQILDRVLRGAVMTLRRFAART